MNDNHCSLGFKILQTEPPQQMAIEVQPNNPKIIIILLLWSTKYYFQQC